MTHVFDDIDDRRFAIGTILVMLSHSVADQSPDLLDIYGRQVLFETGLLHVEVPHSHFTEVSRMTEIKPLLDNADHHLSEDNSLFIEVDAVVMLSASITASSRMFAVFS